MAAAGSGATATWESTIVGSGEGYLTGYQGWNSETVVSTTWVKNPANSTAATYRIYDEAKSNGKITDTLRGTATVDQTKAPIGTRDGNMQFQELGMYYLNPGDTLKVVLSANPSSMKGNVIADSIGIAPALASSGGQSGDGGSTVYETEPAYQVGYQSTGARTAPDVSFVASENTGVDLYQTLYQAVYDSNGAFQSTTVPQSGSFTFSLGGTSLAAPCWAGLIAIANQQRKALGAPALDSQGIPPRP
jgi:hypothetical protein